MRRRISFETEVTEKQLEQLVPSGSGGHADLQGQWVYVVLYAQNGVVDFNTDTLKVENMEVRFILKRPQPHSESPQEEV